MASVRDFETISEGVVMTGDNSLIFEYLYDSKMKGILKTFQETDYNTTFCSFFEDEELKDLVVVVSYKNFKQKDGNGLLMFAITDLYKREKEKDAVLSSIEEEMIDNRSPEFLDDIVNSVNAKFKMSVQRNVK